MNSDSSVARVFPGGQYIFPKQGKNRKSVGPILVTLTDNGLREKKKNIRLQSSNFQWEKLLFSLADPVCTNIFN